MPVEEHLMQSSFTCYGCHAGKLPVAFFGIHSSFVPTSPTSKHLE